MINCVRLGLSTSVRCISLSTWRVPLKGLMPGESPIEGSVFWFSGSPHLNIALCESTSGPTMTESDFFVFHWWGRGLCFKVFVSTPGYVWASLSHTGGVCPVSTCEVVALRHLSFRFSDIPRYITPGAPVLAIKCVFRLRCFAPLGYVAIGSVLIWRPEPRHVRDCQERLCS